MLCPAPHDGTNNGSVADAPFRSDTATAGKPHRPVLVQFVPLEETQQDLFASLISSSIPCVTPHAASSTAGATTMTTTSTLHSRTSSTSDSEFIGVAQLQQHSKGRMSSTSHLSSTTSHLSSSNVSLLRTSAHTFVSNNLPNLSFSHIPSTKQQTPCPPHTHAHQQCSPQSHLNAESSSPPSSPRSSHNHCPQVRAGRSFLVLPKPNMERQDEPHPQKQCVSPNTAAVKSPSLISCLFGQQTTFGEDSQRESPAFFPTDDQHYAFGGSDPHDDLLQEFKPSTPVEEPPVGCGGGGGGASNSSSRSSPRHFRSSVPNMVKIDEVAVGFGEGDDAAGLLTSFDDEEWVDAFPRMNETTSSAVTASSSLSVSPGAALGGGGGGADQSTQLLAKTARDRSLMIHKARLEHFREKQEVTNVRQHQAQERRQFLADHQTLRQAASWSVMLLLALSVSPFQRLAHDLTARRRRRQRMGGVLVYPVLMLGMRRALRRARLHLLTRKTHYAAPSVSTLQSDSMLQMFDEAQLTHAISTMTLRYFFPNEAIIIIGCEDDEGYVLANGAADVVMNTTKLERLRLGMVFGTIGMISGEMRTASVFARGEGCLVWVLKRAALNVSIDSLAVKASLHALAHLRQKNFSFVYKTHLAPAGLRTFPLFHGLCDEALTNFIADASPRVVGGGTVIADPRQPASTVTHFLLLKGHVSVKCAPMSLAPLPQRFTIAEEMRNAIDLPLTGSKGAPLLTHPALSLSQQIKGLHPPLLWEGRDEYRVCAPALLNVNSLFLPGGLVRPTPFVITTITDCDFMSLSRTSLLCPCDANHNSLTTVVAAMQRNALNAHAEFVGTRTKRDIATIVLDSISPLFSKEPNAQATLTMLRNSVVTDSSFLLGPMSCERWVYPCGDVLRFDRSSRFLLNIIFDGELEQVNSPFQPTTNVDAGGGEHCSGVRLWPSLSDAWFAARDAAVKAKTRISCIRIPRRDILLWFCRALPTVQHFREACLIFGASTSAVNRLSYVHGCSAFDLDGKIFSDAEESQRCSLLEVSARQFTRSARTGGLPFTANDATIEAVLRLAVNYVAEQLLQRQHDEERSSKLARRSTEVFEQSIRSFSYCDAPRDCLPPSVLAAPTDNNDDAVSSPASPQHFLAPSPPSSLSPHLSPGDFRHMMSSSISVSPTTMLPTSNTIFMMGNSPSSDVTTKPKFQAPPIRTALVSVSSFVSIAKTSPSASYPQQQAGQQPQPPRQSHQVVLNCRSFKQFTRFGSDGSLPTSPRGGQGLPPVSPTANPSPRSFASLPPTVSPHPPGTRSEKDNAEQHPLPPFSARVASSPSLLRPASSPQNAPRQQNVGASSNARGGSSSTVISPRALTSASSARVLSAGGITKNRTTLRKKSK